VTNELKEDHLSNQLPDESIAVPTQQKSTIFFPLLSNIQNVRKTLLLRFEILVNFFNIDKLAEVPGTAWVNLQPAEHLSVFKNVFFSF